MRQTERMKALEKTLSLDEAAILSPAEVRILVREVRRLLGPAIDDSPVGATIRVEDSVRWASVGKRCRQARAERGLSIKHASVALGVPQYRLKAIEAGALRELRPDMMRRYIRFLGIDAWVGRWCQANVRLARRAGLLEVVGPAGPRRRRKRAV